MHIDHVSIYTAEIFSHDHQGQSRHKLRSGNLAWPLLWLCQDKVAPIMTIAGVGPSSATLDYEHGPVAIMLDLMNPVSAFGRLVGQAG